MKSHLCRVHVCSAEPDICTFSTENDRDILRATVTVTLAVERIPSDGIES